MIVQTLILLVLVQQLKAANFQSICQNYMCRCKSVYGSSYVQCKFTSVLDLPSRSSAPVEDFVTFDLLRNDDSRPAILPKGLFKNLTIDSLNMFNLNLMTLEGSAFEGIESVSNFYLANNFLTAIDFTGFPEGFSRDLVLLSLKNNLLEVIPNMNNLVSLT